MKLLRVVFTTIKGLLVLGAFLAIAFAVAFSFFLFGGPNSNSEHVMLEPKDEVEPFFDIGLDPLGGAEIGVVYEAYLSPQQEAEEESDVPPGSPEVFLSTAPSVDREERDSRGHGTLTFNKEMSRAYVHLEIANIDPDDIVLMHLHCGKPGQLGPIIVDFGATGDLADYFADNVLSYEITNADVAAATHGHGIVGALTAGCPIIPTIPMDRHRTVAGLAHIAAEGDIYFNLHTRQQTFYGDIRGQLQRVPDAVVRSMVDQPGETRLIGRASVRCGLGSGAPKPKGRRERVSYLVLTPCAAWVLSRCGRCAKLSRRSRWRSLRGDPVRCAGRGVWALRAGHDDKKRKRADAKAGCGLFVWRCAQKD